MNPLKKLAGQTAIYGLSSIIGRTINFLLVPWYTGVFAPKEFGVYTEMYAYVAFLIVLCTYGMETTLFRFASKEEYDENKVYSTTLISIISTSILFILTCILFSDQLSTILKYPNHSEYVIWFGMIIGFDAISSIPLVKLRRDNKPMKFAFVNLANIVVYITLNLFFLVYLPYAYKNGGNFLTDNFYSGEPWIGVIFISNLIASIVKLLLMYKELISVRLEFVYEYWKKMIPYALPMMLVGFMGIINETFDRIILKYVLEPIKGLEGAQYDLGIYGANYKIAMIMSMVVQAFRYAAEPFFFGKDKDKDKKKNLATVFKMLTATLSLMFLGIVLLQDVVMILIDEEYRIGRDVVPILLLANLFLGLLMNVSMWYKLTNKTYLGAIVSLIGALITIALNFTLIPIFGYLGSAWATLICYFIMLIISLAWGQKHYPVNYPIKRAILYIGSAVLIYLSTTYFLKVDGFLEYAIKIPIILAFIGFIYALERPKKMVS